MTAVVLASGCAAKPPPPQPATVASAPVASKRTPPRGSVDSLLDEKTPGNPRANTPECRALRDDFAQSMGEAESCNRDEDCTVTFEPGYSCVAQRVDSLPAFQRKREALQTCLSDTKPPNCSSLKAFCIRYACRVSRPRRVTDPDLSRERRQAAP
jgi:hypothetical protein